MARSYNSSTEDGEGDKSNMDYIHTKPYLKTETKVRKMGRKHKTLNALIRKGSEVRFCLQEIYLFHGKQKTNKHKQTEKQQIILLNRSETVI